MCWIQLVRPFTLLPPLLGVLSGAAAAWGTGRQVVDGWEATWSLALGALVAATLNGASNVLNQVHDLELDRINKPERPLPAGTVSVRAASGFAWVLYGVAVSLAFCVQPAGFPEVGVIVVLTGFLTWAYSSPPFRLRSHWWAAPLVIAIPRGGLLKVAGWGCLAPIFSDREPWILGLVFFLFILGAAPTKDFEDMEGDRQAGADSLPLRFGPARAARLMAPFYVLPWAALMVLPWVAVGGAPLLSVQPVAATLVGGVLLAHGSLTALGLVRRTQGSGTSLGRAAWRNLYLLMMEAQIGLALLYLLWPL